MEYPVDPLNEASQLWEDELESLRNGSRTEPPKRRGGKKNLQRKRLCTEDCTANEYFTYYRLEYKTQSSLETTD